MEKADASKKHQPRMLAVLVALLVVCIVALIFRSSLRAYLKTIPVVQQWLGQKTIAQQIEIYGPIARHRLEPTFKAAGMKYPPNRVGMVAIKDKGELQVYVTDDRAQLKYLKTYPILGASGHIGPKLRVGDCQVPEGIYSLSLEPNTPYHLALRLNYPNSFDWQHAREEGRNPGSDILVHGGDGSVGCLAMGDPASEDLFVLAHDAADRNVEIVICPVDFRIARPPAPIADEPGWVPSLYKRIAGELSNFPVQNAAGVPSP